MRPLDLAMLRTGDYVIEAGGARFIGASGGRRTQRGILAAAVRTARALDLAGPVTVRSVTAITPGRIVLVVSELWIEKAATA